MAGASATWLCEGTVPKVEGRTNTSRCVGGAIIVVRRAPVMVASAEARNRDGERREKRFWNEFEGSEDETDSGAPLLAASCRTLAF